MTRPLAGKLLSHRLRGFGPPENSADALRRACEAEIAYLEIDTRATRDGLIFVSHSPWAGSRRRRLRFARMTANMLCAGAASQGVELFTLAEALQIFADHSAPLQKLCIDIKDSGFESACLSLVRKSGLESRVIFVSWMPQSLMRLHEMGVCSPLVLAYCDLRRLGYFGMALERLIQNRVWRIGWLVLLGRNTVKKSLGSVAHGYQHGLMCARLPAELTQILKASNGGVCVSRWLVSRTLADACVAEGLRLWTFGVRTVSGFRAYAKQSAVDVVFCDDAATVHRALIGSRPVLRK